MSEKIISLEKEFQELKVLLCSRKDNNTDFWNCCGHVIEVDGKCPDCGKWWCSECNNTVDKNEDECHVCGTWRYD